MHLLLGDPQDPCCLGVRALLEARNYPTRIIENPLAHPARFALRLDGEGSASQLVWGDEPPLLDEQIAGVLVRTTGRVDPIGWEHSDLIYMQAETQAALLAWLWSLPCPVVNRYPAVTWYQPRAPLLSWRRLLRQCGLPTLETLVTNVEQEARAFGRRLARQGMAGAVYGPLTSDVRYLVTSDDDWSGLAAMQRVAPVSLANPYGAAHFACVVGEQVVWDGEPSPEMTLFEPALRRFATAAGLAFVELAFAPTLEGICVIAVEPHPHLERFRETARQQIVEGMVQLLTAEAGDSHEGAAQTTQRSPL